MLRGLSLDMAAPECEHQMEMNKSILIHYVFFLYLILLLKRRREGNSITVHLYVLHIE